MARILLLEDDDNLRETLDDILTDIGGHYVDCAGNGESALELAHRHVFDVMISDIRMAGIDGLITVSRIKKIQRGLPIIMITGMEVEGDRGRAVDIAVDAYIHKGELTDLYGGIQGTLKIVNSVLRQPDQKGLLATLLEPIWAKPRQVLQNYRDKVEKGRQEALQGAKGQLEESRDMAYRRLVTAIMSNMILQGPSLDIYDQLTEIDIAYARSESMDEVHGLHPRYEMIREKIAQQEKNPGSSYSVRPPDKLTRPAWKIIYEKVKRGIINATQLQYLERLRWMKPDQLKQNPEWEVLRAEAFPQDSPVP